ncbi:hypothetical protein MPH_01641 [Macrophomina phaseolina MS6]|uniref:Uncharacterized protein n=2 Tax=Macrophomina phaseolina TaxID=35725 RepID=K2S7Y9_MACPH|nr:hypothetical protein MPH_01641 [Macrophomina phaseolina MS6]
MFSTDEYGDETLYPHPRRSSDSLFVLTSHQHLPNITPNTKPHRHLFPQPNSNNHDKKKEMAIQYPHNSQPLTTDGPAEPSTSSLFSLPRQRQRRRRATKRARQTQQQHKNKNTTRAERIGRRLRNPDALLHRALVTPLLVLFAVPVAVLTCPICAVIVVRNTLVAK